jgi:hypothetical protein
MRLATSLTTFKRRFCKIGRSSRKNLRRSSPAFESLESRTMLTTLANSDLTEVSGFARLIYSSGT